jgi:hypothetical protein
MRQKVSSSAVFLTGILAAFGCASDHGHRSDAYSVYAAALDSFPSPDARPIRVSSRTWRYSPVRQLGDTSVFYRTMVADTGVGQLLLARLDSVNAVSSSLCDCFSPSSQVLLVVDTLRAGEPGPLVLSNVAYSRKGDRALVALGYSCGALCGHWRLYLVTRSDRGWRVSRTVLSGSS